MSAASLIQSHGSAATTTRPTFATDAAGHPKPTFAPNLTALTVFVQDRSGAETVRYGRESERRFAVLYAPSGSDILVQDKIVVGSRTFDVQTVRTRGTGILAHMILECEETVGGP